MLPSFIAFSVGFILESLMGLVLAGLVSYGRFNIDNK